jgi:hypothetical protein
LTAYGLLQFHFLEQVADSFPSLDIEAHNRNQNWLDGQNNGIGEFVHNK